MTQPAQHLSPEQIAAMMRDMPQAERAQAIAAAGDRVIDMCDADTAKRIFGKRTK